MLLSRASRLATEALVELSEQDRLDWMKAAELGRRINAEVPFLKQVLTRLTRAGLIRARPGRSGGYQLACNPQLLPLHAVAQAVDGRDLRQQCLFDPTACDGTKSCRMSPTWHSMRDSLVAFLEAETIHAIAARSRGAVDRFERSELDA